MDAGRRDELARARVEVLAAQKRATRKAGRIRREYGAEVAGTKYDPRKSKDAINRMTLAQAQAQLARVEKFNSRKTQFVGLHRGEPLPMRDWRKYRKLEAKGNAAREAWLDTFGNVQVDASNTVADMIYRRTPTKMMSSAPNATAFKIIDRDPENINGRKAFLKVVESAKRQADPEYIKNRLRIEDETAQETMRKMGDEDMLDSYLGLTEQERWALLQTDFTNNFYLRYKLLQMEEGKRGTGHNNLLAQTNKSVPQSIEKFKLNSRNPPKKRRRV